MDEITAFCDVSSPNYRREMLMGIVSHEFGQSKTTETSFTRVRAPRRLSVE
jgi:hypothetical protein